MPILPELSLPIMLFIVSVCSFILSLGYTLYYYLHQRHNPKGSSGDPRDIALHEAVKIVDSARGKAMDMLGEAHNEAKAILTDSENVHSSVKETFDQKMQVIGQKQMASFDQMSKDLVESYKAVLDQEKDSSLKSLTEVSSELKSQLTTDMHYFKDKIKKITDETEGHIKNDVEGQFNEISTHLNSLKENLQKITETAEKEVRENIDGDFNLVKTEIENFANSIKQVSDETSSKLKGELSEEYNAAKDVISGLSDDLRKIVEETEVELKKGVKEEYDQVRAELEGYKTDRYKKIDGVVRGMLEEVARDVLGKTMNAKDHEELIIRSLDSIKRTTNLKEL